MGPLLEHSANIARNQAVGTNGRRSFSTLYTQLGCSLQPLSRQAAIHANMEPGRSFDVFFGDGTDVLVGDRLTISGVNYIVKGVQAFTLFPLMNHVRAFVETEHANGL